MTDTETDIVHFNQPVDLALFGMGSITGMVNHCVVDFTVEFAPLPFPRPVMEMKRAQLA